jgi:ornithine cyclodeaminase/alanine dehydrogenase
MKTSADGLLYLSDADVVAADVRMSDVIAAVEAAFRAKGEGRAQAPPKAAIHPLPDALIHAMPASLEHPRAAGMKWVSAYPRNRARGLPAVLALVVINDPDTGRPLAIMDGRWITAQRTAAASAVAAKYLARPDSESLGVLGCGVQARSHVEALRELFRLRRICAYDRHRDRAVAFAQEVESRFGIGAVAVHEPRAAVAGLDLVVTAGAITRPPHATIDAGWLSPGAFASLVDFDAYWSAAALAEADRFCTDDSAQFDGFRASGELPHAPAVHADLGELVSGRRPGRESREERTIACNLGLAICDIATAALVYDKALERGLGMRLPA